MQSSERNLYGRSVRLDALCTLRGGKKVNIEVQRSDNDDHLRRVRFNAASITVKESHSGDDYKDIPEVIVVYISEFDFLKGGRTIYHVDKVLRETGAVVDDGQHEIFVNTAIDDRTDISELMECFKEKLVQSKKFPELSQAVMKYKTTEGGATVMCEVMQKYEAIAEQRGEKRGEKKGSLSTLIGLVRDGLLSSRDACIRADMTEQEFDALVQSSSAARPS